MEVNDLISAIEMNNYISRYLSQMKTQQENQNENEKDKTTTDIDKEMVYLEDTTSDYKIIL